MPVKVLVICFSFIFFVSYSSPCSYSNSPNYDNYKDSVKNKQYFIKDKIVPAAFVLLTGLVGGHRIVLGTDPLVPVVYAATLGGGLGVLPLIDFFYILFTREPDKLKSNKKIFLWIGNEGKKKPNQTD